MIPALLVASFASYGLETGQILACDTPKQVIAVLSVKEQKIETTIAQVNHGTHACAILTVAFLRGPKVDELLVPAGHFDILKVTIVGGMAEGSWRWANQPLEQFSGFFQKSDDI